MKGTLILRLRPVPIVALIFVLATMSDVTSLKIAAQESSFSPAGKLRRAEETVARFLRRFNETLDFGVPYRELFLPESHWPGRARGPLPAVSLRIEKIEDEMEVAMMNLWYLRAAYLLAHGGPNLPPEIKAARGEELFPYLEDLNYLNKQPPRVQRRKWRDYLNNVARLAALYRRFLPPSAFAAPDYQARIEEVDRATAGNRPRARVELGFNNHKEFERREVYKVLRGGMEYTLIEVEGAFKVIHINPLPNFRMSP